MRYRLCKRDCDEALRVTESDVGGSTPQIMSALQRRKVVGTGDLLYVEDLYYERTVENTWALVPATDPRLVGLYRKMVEFEMEKYPGRPRREL